MRLDMRQIIFYNLQLIDYQYGYIKTRNPTAESAILLEMLI